MYTEFITQYYPTNYPKKMNGTFTTKIIIKDDYVRADGTCALYLQLFLNSKRRRIPLGVSVPIKLFDKKKQRLKGTSQLAIDSNLIIARILGSINEIAITYRLNGQFLTLEKLVEDLTNPTAKVDFLKFYYYHLEKQKDILKPGTYRQQKSTLNKLEKFRKSILFYEITPDLLREMVVYMRKKLKNEQTTISTTLKNFKKYLHIANENGINTPLKYTDIEVKSFSGNRTFLNGQEIEKMYKYWCADFINSNHKSILSRFLFSCFTGIRLSDMMVISQENIVGNYLVFTASKTGKFQRILLNNSAKTFINKTGPIFNDAFTPEFINRELKTIAGICGIKKKVSFHVSRHSFATNFLIEGGKVENLQTLLGHSSIKHTMIYVHIVESVLDAQIIGMDSIISLK